MRDLVAKWKDKEFMEPLLEDIWNTYGRTGGQAIQVPTTAEKKKIYDRVLDQTLEVAREG